MTDEAPLAHLFHLVELYNRPEIQTAMEGVLATFLTDADPRKHGKRLYESLLASGYEAFPAKAAMAMQLRSVYFQIQQDNDAEALHQEVLNHCKFCDENLQSKLASGGIMDVITAKTLIADARRELMGRMQAALGIKERD